MPAIADFSFSVSSLPLAGSGGAIGMFRWTPMQWAGSWMPMQVVTAMHSRVSERFEHLVKLDYRAGPSVGDNERQRTGMRRADMDKVNSEPVNFGLELRKTVQQRFSGTPVVFLQPVGGDLLRIR